MNDKLRALDVDALAQEIQRVDGSHLLDAGALAEALVPYIASLLPPSEAEEGVAVGSVVKATLREACDTFHIECHFADGQKFAAVQVAKECEDLAYEICQFLNLEASSAAPELAATPPAAEVWQPIETAPQNSKVLVAYQNRLGNWRRVLATYYAPGTLDASDDCDDADDNGCAPAGWYEECETAECIKLTDEPPVLWAQLPDAPAALRPFTEEDEK